MSEERSTEELIERTGARILVVEARLGRQDRDIRTSKLELRELREDLTQHIESIPLTITEVLESEEYRKTRREEMKAEMDDALSEFFSIRSRLKKIGITVMGVVLLVQPLLTFVQALVNIYKGWTG